MQKNNSY